MFTRSWYRAVPTVRRTCAHGAGLRPPCATSRRFESVSTRSGTSGASSQASAQEQHRVVVVGSTGGVGRRVVHFMAQDPRVERVTAVTRRPPCDTSMELFQLEPTDAAKVSFAVVDFDKLADDGEGASLLAGHTVGVSCLGLYTNDARDEEHFRRVEIELNVAAASAAAAGGVTRYAYLSGQGASKGGWAMFARVKADAEEALRAVPGIMASAAMRPGMIMGSDTTTAQYGGATTAVVEWWFNNVGLAKLGLGVDVDEIAKAMVEATTTADVESVADVYENNAIRNLAGVYDESLARAQREVAAAALQSTES